MEFDLVEVEVQDNVYFFSNIEIEDYYTENDGIGNYECHGVKGFDSGNDYILVNKCYVEQVSIVDELGNEKIIPLNNDLHEILCEHLTDEMQEEIQEKIQGGY